MDALYEAVYDLSSVHKHVLSFRKGDRFIPLSSKTKDPSWIFAVDLRGRIGFVPVNYVRSQPIPKKELADVIEAVLEAIEVSYRGFYTEKQRQIIQELTTWRTLLLSPVHSPVHSSHTDEGKPKKQQKHCRAADASVVLNHDGHVETTSVENDSHAHRENINPEKHVEACGKRAPASEVVHSSHVQEQQKQPVVNDLPPSHFPSPAKRVTVSDAAVQCVVPVEAKSVVTERTDSENLATQFPEEHLQAKAPTSAMERTTACCSNCKDSIDHAVPEWLVPKLVENVRSQTQLSHQNSKVAVAVVLNTLLEGLPEKGLLWNKLRSSLEKCEVSQERDENVGSEDKRKLMDIFRQLWCCKNDEQQRSWPVHEDEALISSLLENLDAILMDADPRVTKEVVQHDDYELVNLLVTYYQMEPRRVLRLKMLQIFVTLCELDLTVVGQLLTSVLPMELASDMRCTYADEEKLQYSAFVLTIIFSTGQTPPNAIYEFFQDKFLTFLYEWLEVFMRNGKEGIGNHLLNILLAFNLHLKDKKPNIVFECLKSREDARMLTEKLVFLLNREEDPVRILNHPVDMPNSVLKFLVDFFGYPELVPLFYLNDIKVLLDIIVRQLTDYFPGEKIRLLYLHLVRNVLRNSNYSEHFHQKEFLQKCFHAVFAHDVDCPEETAFVSEILNEFSSWFSLPES